MRSRRLPWILFGLCVVPFVVGMNPQQIGDPAKWSTSQWIAWRDDQIKQIFTPTFDSGNEKVLLRREVVEKSALAHAFLSQFVANPKFLKDPAREKALGHFVKFVSALHMLGNRDAAGVSTHLFGMSVSDSQYWARISRWMTFPPLLKSQVFLSLLSSPTTYKAAADMIEVHNKSLSNNDKWTVALFRAQFVKSVDDTTYGRMLVLVPNEKLSDGRILDEWIMFALATPDMPADAPVRSVSFIATVRDPAKPNTHQAFFCDFMRDSLNGKISLNPTLLMNNSPSKNCYECHKSAILPIRPKYTLQFDSRNVLREDSSGQSAVLKQMNGMVPKYGNTDFGLLDPDSYGPTLGLRHKPVSAESIVEWTKGISLPPESAAKVQAAMNCASCHDDFARINYPLALRSDQEQKSFEAKKGLVQTTIEQGFMPPNNTLNANERHALWVCLSKEYLNLAKHEGLFLDWLRGSD